MVEKKLNFQKTIAESLELKFRAKNETATKAEYKFAAKGLNSENWSERTLYHYGR